MASTVTLDTKQRRKRERNESRESKWVGNKGRVKRNGNENLFLKNDSISSCDMATFYAKLLAKQFSVASCTIYTSYQLCVPASLQTNS